MQSSLNTPPLHSSHHSNASTSNANTPRPHPLTTNTNTPYTPSFQKNVEPPSYTFGDMGRDLLQAIQRPLGLIAMIPIVAGVGALTAFVFTPISPLAGAIILGNCAGIAVYTSFACKMLGLNDKQTILASLITSIFLTNIASIAAFSYLRMPPISILKITLLTIGTGVELAIMYAFLKNISDPT